MENKSIYVTLFAALLLLSCSSSSGGDADTGEVVPAADAATETGSDEVTPEDLVAELPPELPDVVETAEELTPDVPAADEGNGEIALQPAWVKGRVIDDQGDPLTSAFLVLCGTVGGKYECNQGKADADGYFIYQGLMPGYTHLTVLAFATEAATGKRYAGANVVSEVETEDTKLDMGDIVIPVVEQTTTVVAADGAMIKVSGVELTMEAGSLTFPDAAPEGEMAIVDVPPEGMPFSPEGVLKAYALYPFSAMLIPEGKIKFYLDEIDPELAAKADQLKVLHNDMEHGGLIPIEHEVDGTVLTVFITDLTWVALGE